ncbi:uncharacterized protein B0H18DRAFT_957801 [Fomitopsis serialis]|uniref:uncharacterized protein n=1 Tax=Fomitopsis serialis TaxID=139415 RepID=UPI00200803B7|nr:uncharacterized protein B0H18DRAFT_957801 [Neoantrodia serialis]KAH9918806.1 hypothetical protein B0H18DRAFT_957801 [Neoantrodia serialis]
MLADYEKVHGFHGYMGQILATHTHTHDPNGLLTPMQCTIWPPVREAVQSQINFLSTWMLDIIAQDITSTLQPSTELYGSSILHPDKIYKCEGSCGHLHVIRGCDEDALDIINHDLDKIREYRWLAQEWVPTLQDGGQLRVIQLCDGGDNYVNEDCFAHDGGTHAQWTTAALQDFVLMTLQHVIDSKTLLLRMVEESSLEQYTHVDIRVMPGADGKLAWFVNKIKWGVSATVFLNADPDLTCPMINEAVDSILTLAGEWAMHGNTIPVVLSMSFVFWLMK